MPDEIAEAVDHGHHYWRTPVVVTSVVVDEPEPADLDHEFTRFAEYMPTLCWLARGDGYIVWYNRRWHEYCGTTPAQMEGWGWQDVHDAAQLPLVMERWTNSVATGEPFEMQFPLRGADGIFRPFLTRVIPVRNAANKVIRWYGVNTEIGTQVAAQRALIDSEASFATLTDAMPQMVWSTRPDGHHDYYNARWYAFTGIEVGSTDGDGWSDLFHPDDRELAWDRWRHSLATGEPYEVEYRLRHHSGDYRWTLGRALPVMNEGKVTRWIGTCTDIDDAKRSAEQNELLSRELSHRIKNIFAVIAGLISLTGRNAPELKPMTKDLLDRIAALGRAHEFARPHSSKSAPTIATGTLHGLMKQILTPYERAGSERIVISGDDVPVDDRGATPLSLVTHELATNSAKYGALSVEHGSVAITVSRSGDDTVVITWSEHGGPTLHGQPTLKGFGSELARLSVEQQLGGKISYDWRPSGLIVTFELSLARLHR